MTFGTDPRRTTWSPTDAARAEALVARFGGILTTTIPTTTPASSATPPHSGHGAGVAVEWYDPTGYRVALEGADAPAVLGLLSAVLRDRHDADLAARSQAVPCSSPVPPSSLSRRP